MRRISAVLMAVAGVAALAPPALAKKQNPAAVALFKKAIAASDLEAKGSTAYRLQATVRVFGANNQYTDGMLVKFWTPDGKWREETFLQGYQLVETSDGEHLWTRNDVNYMSYDVHELWTALAFDRRLQWWIDGGVTPFAVAGVMEAAYPPGNWRVHLGKPTTKGHPDSECVKVENLEGVRGNSCFDAATGRLTRLIDADGVRYEYSDYAELDQKSFPRTIRVFEGQNTELLEVHIDSIYPLTEFPPGMFLPAPGSDEGPAPASCLHVKPLKIAKEANRQPRFVANGKTVRGVLALYGYVGTDGVLRGVVVLQSPSPLLTAAAPNAFRGLQFRPAVCDNGSAIQPMNVTIDVRILLMLTKIH